MNSVEVQEKLGISRQTLYSWVKSGRLVANEKKGIAGTLLFNRDDVETAREDRIAELIAQFEKMGIGVELVRRSE